MWSGESQSITTNATPPPHITNPQKAVHLSLPAYMPAYGGLTACMQVGRLGEERDAADPTASTEIQSRAACTDACACVCVCRWVWMRVGVTAAGVRPANRVGQDIYSSVVSIFCSLTTHHPPRTERALQNEKPRLPRFPVFRFLDSRSLFTIPPHTPLKQLCRPLCLGEQAGVDGASF